MINVKKYNDRIDVSERTIYDGIKFILFHFEKQQKLFPRTIKTNNSIDAVKVDDEPVVQNSVDNIFNIFKGSNYYDCKINCLYYTNDSTPPYNNDAKSFKNKSKTATAIESSFIMLYLYLNDFSYNKKKLDIILNKTLNKLSAKFYGDANPTVLWTGDGYQIYQPLDGIVFENQKTFLDLLQYVDSRSDISTEFLRFAQEFFTNEKVGPKYFSSLKSCFMDVPGTFNFKNGEQIKIIHKWDGKYPSIRWVTYDFKNYLIQKRIDCIHKRKKEIVNRMSSHYQQQDK